jgi:uncharacterized protein YkwD
MQHTRLSLLPLGCLLCAGCTWLEDIGPGHDSVPDGDTAEDTASDTGDPTDTGVPDPSECDPSVVGWPAAWVELEDAVLAATNAVRQAGADCGKHGLLPAAGPLVMEPHLRCAARVHALDMGTRDYFDHASEGGPLGDTFDERIRTAGFSGLTMGENIAAGYPSVEAVLAAWVDSDGHCANLMNGAFTDIGIGYASVPGSTYGRYWVQDFGG